MTTLNVHVGSTNAVIAKLRSDDSLGNKVFATHPKKGINAGSASAISGRTYFAQFRSKGSNPAAYDVSLVLSLKLTQLLQPVPMVPLGGRTWSGMPALYSSAPMSKTPTLLALS